MFGLFGQAFVPNSWQRTYRVYPVSFLDKEEAEHADKVFLPPSALDQLAQRHIEYPMLFKVTNKKTNRSTHCGVLEFIAEEGRCYLPYWMMQNLLLEEGELVQLESTSLPKGRFVKLQPHTKDFLDISNPKAVLEKTLRGFACLTVGDTITIHYNNRKYFIDIIEAKPQNSITVIETDCEVDFAPPLDYEEPGRDEGPTAAEQASTSAAASAGAAAQEEPEQQQPSFIPFAGSGRRLDGKAPTNPAIPMPSSSGAGPSTSAAAPATASNGAAAPVSRQKQGKVVFAGGNRLAAKQAASKDQQAAPAPPKEDKKEEPKFAAFSGKPRTLKG